MPQYSVLQPISHDGKPYKQGSTIELSQDAAEELLELKAIAVSDSPPESIPLDENPLIVTQQVSEVVEPADPSVPPPEESVDPKKAPPSTARKQQQKGDKE